MSLKKDKMTGAERFTALLKRQPVDRVSVSGFAGGYAAINVGYEIRDVYTNPQKMIDAARWTAEQYDWDGVMCGDVGMSVPHTYFRPGKTVRMPDLSPN